MKKMLIFFNKECLFSQEMKLDAQEFVVENSSLDVSICDIEKDKDIANHFRVFGTPSILMLNDNKPYCRIIGIANKNTLFDFYHHECEHLNEL
jgi:thioredoxin-related protein